MRFVILALILAAFVRWVLPIGSSLWLDETDSWWSIKQGFLAIPERCTQHPVSVVFMQMLWTFQRVFGHSEWALRLSSLLLMGASTWLLYSIAKRLFSRQGALAATVVFMALPNVAFGSVDARPYALATFLTVLSTFLLVQWRDRPTLWRAIFYAASVGFIFNVHYLFMLVVLPHVAYLAFEVRRGFRPELRQLLVICVVAFAAAGPSLAAFIRLAGARGHFSFAPPPGIRDLFRELVPRVVLIAVAIAILVAAFRRRLGRTDAAASSDGIVLAAAWGVAPILALFAVSTLSASTVFQSRYLLVAAPGLALIYGAVLNMARPAIVKAGLLALVVASSIGQAWLTGALFSHTAPGLGNWRDALRYVDARVEEDGAPVLIRSQYIESDYMDWNEQPISDNSLFTPLSYYPARANLVPLPVSLGPKVASELQTFAAGVFTNHDRFFLISVDGPTPLAPFLRWFEQRWPGLEVHKLGDFNGVLVYEFRRPAP